MKKEMNLAAGKDFPGESKNQMRENAEEVRGNLHIFLGYAEGVGKTYAMLEAARLRFSAGVDVVVGIVDTHGRPEMDSLLEDLEFLPRRPIDPVPASPYAGPGKPSHEMDTDAILARQPQIVIVDDLAHTNAPGLRHARRYQDVIELLSNGIDVYTTVNVNQLESLKDVIVRITGVSIPESVPDYVLDEAYEVVLVDLPIDELIMRLDMGKVAFPPGEEAAWRKLFRPGNLNALREMALRRAAQRVDEEMRAYMQQHAILGPWPVSERLLVCVGPSPLSERLVRSTRRLARWLRADWIAVYVETPESIRLPASDQDRITRTLHLAEELGAEVLRLNGRSVAETVVSYAISRNVSKIVVGKPLRRRWQELLRGSLVDQLLKESQDLDLYVISGKSEASQVGKKPRKFIATSPTARQTTGWRAYLLSAGLVGLATLAGLPLRPYINPTNLVMLYFVAVMVAAIWLGLYPAIVASLLSVIAFDVIFVPPYYTLAIADAQYLLTFAGLLAIGLVITTLTSRAREQEMAARTREAQTVALYELSQKLATVTEMPEIAHVAVQHVQATLGHPAGLFLTPLGSENSGDLPQLLAATTVFQLERDAVSVAEWVCRHGQPAGHYTDTLTTAKEYYLPLQTSGRTIGALAIEFTPEDKNLITDERRFLASFASQVALALEKAQLADKARQTRLLEETEKLQTALLNSISHDLRTPLASITGALSSLLEDAALLSEAARTELLLTAWEESIRLNRLVGNLLDMTRLQSGAFKIVCQPNDVEDLVGATLAQMPRRLNGRVVRSNIPPGLPLVEIDLALAVQALVNLVDNALKFTPLDKPIEIEAYTQGEYVIVAVKDHGPGLSEGDSNLIFNKFFRGYEKPVSEETSVGGIGLGLSIAKGIVEAHGGEIWAANRPEGGAVFSLSLPVIEAGQDMNVPG
jgi:two-component system sensor histidine kinase KdpD